MSTPFLVVMTIWTLLVVICIHLNFRAAERLRDSLDVTNAIVREQDKAIRNIIKRLNDDND